MISSLCTSSCPNEHVVSVLLANIKEYFNITKKKIALKFCSSAFIKIHFGDHSNVTCGQTQAKQSEGEFLDIFFSMATTKILRDLGMRR